MALDNGTVLILITLAVLPIAAFSFARSGGAWRKVGKGAFAIEEEAPPPPRSGGEVDRAAQEAEARQMLEAKSFRREREGLPAIDVEAELTRLLVADSRPAEPSLDAELREEVRRLVIAGNERRRRRGEPELDVEVETERQLAEFA
jgi:hypothetical protein